VISQRQVLLPCVGVPETRCLQHVQGRSQQVKPHEHVKVFVRAGLLPEERVHAPSADDAPLHTVTKQQEAQLENIRYLHHRAEQ